MPRRTPSLELRRQSDNAIDGIGVPRESWRGHLCSTGLAPWVRKDLGDDKIGVK